MSLMPMPPGHPGSLDPVGMDGGIIQTLMRLRNLFGGNKVPSPNMPNGPVVTDMIGPMPGSVNTGYEPQTGATDNFRTALGEIPQRENFKPSIWRNIGAGVKGLGAGGPLGMWGGVPVGWSPNLKAADEFRDRPFNQALNDWDLQTKGLGTLAKLETDSNDSFYDRENQRIDNELNREQYERQLNRDRIYEDSVAGNQRRADERLVLDRKKFELAQMKADKWQFREIAGGNVMAFNPNNPSQVIDTGVKSGDLSDYERMTLGLNHALARQENQGDITRGNQQAGIDARAQNDWSSPTQTYGADGKPGPVIQVNNATGETRVVNVPQQGVLRNVPPGSGTSSGTNGEIPSRVAGARVNKATDIVNANPDLREFFMTDSNGKPTGVMAEPPSNLFGWNQAKIDRYNKAKQLFIGQEPPMGRTNSANPATAPVARPNPNIPNEPPAGSVFMMAPDQKELAVVPEARIQEFIDKGYSRVRRRQ